MAQDMDLAEQGIAAYKSGNVSEARRILAQAVKTTDRANDQAWYYLAKTQTDPEKRQQCLQMALKLNPNYNEARIELDVLEKRMAAEAASAPDNVIDIGKAAPRSKASSDSGSAENRTTTSASSQSVRVPPGIPGAPERLSLTDVQTFVQRTVQDSLAIFQGKMDSLTTPITAWDAVMLVGLTGFALGILLDLRQLIVMLQGAQFGIRLNLVSLIMTPFLVTLIALIAAGAGVFLSHWYITTQQGGRASLLAHAAALLKIWAPASLLLGLVGLIGSLLSAYVVTVTDFLRGASFNTGGLSLLLMLIAAGITAYAASLMVKGLQKLYTNPSLPKNHYWITALIMIFVTALLL